MKKMPLLPWVGLGAIGFVAYVTIWSAIEYRRINTTP